MRRANIKLYVWAVGDHEVAERTSPKLTPSELTDRCNKFMSLLLPAAPGFFFISK